MESFESVGRRFVPYAHAPKACKPAYEEGGLVQIGDDVVELEGRSFCSQAAQRSGTTMPPDIAEYRLTQRPKERFLTPLLLAVWLNIIHCC